MVKSKLIWVEKIGVYFCRNYIEKARERIRQVRKSNGNKESYRENYRSYRNVLQEGL